MYRALGAVALGFLGLLAEAGSAWAAPFATDGFVGSERCEQCHAELFTRWQGSAHAGAMRKVEPQTTAASFDGSTIDWGDGAKATFRQTAGGLEVVLDEPETDSVAVAPQISLGRVQIEQHLVAGVRGRLQALPVGYDTRAGQWFDIFVGDPREPGDWGHWLGPAMTANSECLYCHTTGYAKGYDAAADRFDTTWAEMGVGCESCHGPGAEHAAQAEVGTVAAGDYTTPSGSARLDVCASCHALRRVVADGFEPRDRFLDHFEPVLLDEEIYAADGSVRGEAYEWGSFVQSRMHAEGVECGDCHDAHSGALRRTGDTLCLGCHEQRFAGQEHTRHSTWTTADPPGPGCVDCHMPATTFMARDVRRDHSFSVPDPGLSAELGSPSACDACHADRDSG